MIEEHNGDLLVVGRYRSGGDSRTGLQAGVRGCELAIFRSNDKGNSFEKILKFEKPDLDLEGKEVLSIEGAALSRTASGYELYVSTEKSNIGYPTGFEAHLKPGTGVWSIERLTAPTIGELAKAPVETIIASTDPATLHIKDPFLYDATQGERYLFFCSHPFSWSSSNTGYQTLIAQNSQPVHDFFPRGATWDVAITRGTCLIDVPRIGQFCEQQVSLMFYDGGESLRNLDEHNHAVHRPRGYSCEELGGVAYLEDGHLHHLQRLSQYEPTFISPYGTGCSRYVDILQTDDGFYATWQQSQNDFSQPLVMNYVSNKAAEELLS